MQRYFIVVEGVHDIAAISRYIELIDYKAIRKEHELDDFWKILIPRQFPFNGDLRMRVPVPTFYQGNNKSIAIMNSNGITELVKTVNMLTNIDYELLEGVAVFCDADNNQALETVETLKSHFQNGLDEEFQTKVEWSEFPKSVKENFKFWSYVFPDNNGTGTLENLLLEGASSEYSELYNEAESYIEKLSEKNLAYIKNSTFSGSKKDKMLVRVIANAMKPGKANQVSIQDNNWITNTTLKNGAQRTFEEFLRFFLD